MRFEKGTPAERIAKLLAARRTSVLRHQRRVAGERVRSGGRRADRARCDPIGRVRGAERDRPPAQGPNDPSSSVHWSLENTGQCGGTPEANIHAPETWDVRTDARSVVVAVVDSGITYRHPDLNANLGRNLGEVPGNHLDDDHDGYVDDVYGADTVGGAGDPIDAYKRGNQIGRGLSDECPAASRHLSSAAESAMRSNRWWRVTSSRRSAQVEFGHSGNLSEERSVIPELSAGSARHAPAAVPGPRPHPRVKAT